MDINLMGLENFTDFFMGLAGVLTALVGLIAIGFSITTQQSVQKCRELLWKLKGLTTETRRGEIERLNSDMELYFALYKEISLFRSSFVNDFLSLTQKSLVIVIFLCGLSEWSLFCREFNFLVDSVVSILSVVVPCTIVGGLIWKYRYFLENLGNPLLVGGLPPYEKLIDGNAMIERISWPIEALAAYGTIVLAKRDSANLWSIYIGTNQRFFNLQAWVCFRCSDGSEDDRFADERLRIDGNGKVAPMGVSACWYKVRDFSKDMLQAIPVQKFVVQVLVNKDGEQNKKTTVAFYYVDKYVLLNLCENETYSWLPERIVPAN